MSDAYIDDVLDSEVLNRACEVCRGYAGSFEPGEYKHLLVICGTPEALRKYTKHHNGSLIGDLEGTSLFDEDEKVYELLGRMQKPEGGHRDLAISFYDTGKVERDSVEILTFSRADDAVIDEIMKIKGEVGMGHLSLARGTLNPGIIFGIGLSEDPGTVMPFVEGKIYRPGLYVPEKKIIVDFSVPKKSSKKVLVSSTS